MIAQARKKQKIIIDMLDEAFVKGRLSHAYLFVGDQKEEKLGIALYLACKMYCKDVCLQCKNCQNIQEFKHINVTYIYPQGQSIKKEQIATLQKEFSKTSLEEGPRIYIIEDAHKMTSQAANSLLKFIEEPNADVYGLLLTDNKNAILPTILSRCQVINLLPVDKSEIAIKLTEKGIEKEKAYLLSFLTNNDEEAIKYLDNPIFLTSYKLVKDLGLMISNNKGNAFWHFKDYMSVFEDSENLEFFLKVFLLYVMDSRREKPHIFVDEEERFKTLQKKKDVITIIMDEIVTIQKRLGYNINCSLALECLLLKIDRSV